jgi:hypothetical protein
MAARKIPKNYLVVTGSFASRKNAQMDAFESLLEKEDMLFLDFDESVERFETKPVTIPVPGVPRGYTPDVLCRNAEKYAPKFAAAEQFSRERDWSFRVTTQIDIRTPRLANLKFLREYRNISPME